MRATRAAWSSSSAGPPGLRAQIAEAQESAALPQRQPADGVEAAARRARELLGEVTRATRAPEPPPFGSASRGAAAECPGPGCEVCATCGGDCSLCADDHRQAALRPAGSAARSLEHTGPGCAECVRAGATAAESAQIHAGDGNPCAPRLIRPH